MLLLYIMVARAYGGKSHSVVERKNMGIICYG